MCAAKHHAKPVGLSLVVDNSTVGDRATYREAPSAESIPEGWFEEEVGYVGALPSAVHALADPDESGRDGHD